MEAGRFAKAGELAIADARRLHQLSLGAPAEHARYIYGLRAFTNGLRDLANIRLITEHNGWIEIPLAVEAAWELIHDAGERIFGFDNLDLEFQKYCREQLESVRDSINDRYGPGVYCSWAVVNDSVNCTICNADFRECDHVAGEWYNGEQCLQRPEGGHIQHIAIVDNPEDYRCRFWPWRAESDGLTHRVMVCTAFSVEGDESGGRIINLDQLWNSRQVTK
jgi:hypothetical protein